MRYAAGGIALALIAFSTPARPSGAAVSADSFLNSIGINTHVDQGIPAASYVEPLIYTGVRQVRDGERHIDGDLMLHARTGVHFTINGGGDLQGLLSSARTLARAGALLAVEGPNEPGNFPIHYEGQQGGGGNHTWIPVARFQRALYASVATDHVLSRYPVFSPSEVGAETDDVGLQYLRIPLLAASALPDGTRYANFANVHNYVSGNGNDYGDNQAWNAADPILNARWDGLYGNNGLTWHRHYDGYTNRQLPGLPRVTTETGWDTTANPGGDRTQGTVLTNTYLAQFKRGWAYTFVYEMRDGEGSSGHQGLYSGSTPKLAATYLHNLTSILSGRPGRGAGRLAYTIVRKPGTVHDLLLGRPGRLDLVVWDERVHGEDKVSVDFGRARHVKLYDITQGTSPVQTIASTRSLPLTLSDHAVILEIND